VSTQTPPGGSGGLPPTQERSRGNTLVYALAPLVVLVVVLLVFVRTDPLSSVRPETPPVEELTITRAVLSNEPSHIELSITNGGPDPVTIAQVLVDDAYWRYTIEPGNEISRLGRATVALDYPWVEGEPLAITLISSTGVKFTHEVAVATETPEGTARTLWVFTLIGIFVGVIPVMLGITWLPFLRRLPQKWVDFFLALTAGLLVFLAVDAVHEALEVSVDVPGAFQGVGLIVLGIVGALAALYAVDGWMRSRRQGGLTPLYVSGLIALGIGLHNLGEGLAIGAAFAVGEVGLTSFLIIGFMLHNVTEGLGIVSPLARSRPSIKALVGLGLLAGLPTIVGAWSGGLAYSPTLSVLFLSIGAGAIVQVVWEIAKLLRQGSKEATAPLNAIGFAVGVLVMYLTGLAVAA
jgi:zinc transporter ZupT